MLANINSIAHRIAVSNKRSAPKKYDNTNGRDGIKQSPFTSYNTVPQCQKKCEDTTDCVAIDFNRVTLECFLFIDSTGLPPQQGINHGVDQYVLKRECKEGKSCLKMAFDLMSCYILTTLRYCGRRLHGKTYFLRWSAYKMMASQIKCSSV